MFTLSDKAQISVHKYGNEGNAIIVIDNAVDNPAEFIEDAATRQFKQIGPYFPGIRALTPSNYQPALSNSITEIICKTFTFPPCQWAGETLYSIVTTPPAQLKPMQRIPHHDGTQNTLIAALHYLSPKPQGGTAFFRHRTTGFESITEERIQQYNRALEQDVKQYGIPAARYIGDNDPMFERIAVHEAQFNRMLIYRGITLHSGIIDNNALMMPDPRVGRLTINAFLEPIQQTHS